MKQLVFTGCRRSSDDQWPGSVDPHRFGQGIGAVQAVESAGNAIARLAEQYQQARRALNAA